MLQGLICKRCGNAAPRTGSRQFYCRPCSEDLSRQRAAAWARGNPPSKETIARATQRKKSVTTTRGLALNEAEAFSIGDIIQPVEMAWQVRVAAPFSWASSKNRIYNPNGHHVSLREEVRQYRGSLTMMIRAALAGRVLRQNKVWITLFVQKPQHKGDAINVVDTVCDAIKDAIDIDDRWFSIYRLDWQIVKVDPQLFIGIGQEAGPDVQVCSSCGRLLTFDNFTKKTNQKNGIDRNCRECRRGRH